MLVLGFGSTFWILAEYKSTETPSESLIELADFATNILFWVGVLGLVLVILTIIGYFHLVNQEKRRLARAKKK